MPRRGPAPPRAAALRPPPRVRAPVRRARHAEVAQDRRRRPGGPSAGRPGPCWCRGGRRTRTGRPAAAPGGAGRAAAGIAGTASGLWWTASSSQSPVGGAVQPRRVGRGRPRRGRGGGGGPSTVEVISARPAGRARRVDLAHHRRVRDGPAAVRVQQQRRVRRAAARRAVWCSDRHRVEGGHPQARAAVRRRRGRRWPAARRGSGARRAPRWSPRSWRRR